MANGYKRGDVLIPMLNEIAGELPALQRQGQEFLLKQSALALDNRKFSAAEEQTKIQNAQAKEQQKLAQQNIVEQRNFRNEQAKTREMNTLLNSVTEPYQKQAIYNKYGMYDMAAQMKTQVDKEEDQKTSLKGFYAVSSAKDIVSEGNKALEGLDPTSAAYGQVVARRDSAFNEIQNSYQDMLKDPRYKFQYDILLASAKMPNADITGIFQQMDVMANRFQKEKFGETGVVGASGTTAQVGTKELSMDEQAEQLVVDNILSGEAFKPEGALEFLSPEERESAIEEAKPIQSQFESVSSKLEGLEKQRQSKYDQLESQKSKLSKLAKEARYYSRTGNKEKTRQAKKEYQALQSSITTLSAEVSKLKQFETGLGSPTKFDKSLGAEISRLNRELGTLRRQGRRLSGQPTYGS